MPFRFRRRFTRKRSFRRRRFGGKSRRFRRSKYMFRVAKAATKRVLSQRVERKQFVVDAAPGIQVIQNNTLLGSSPLPEITKGDQSYTRQGSSIFVKWMVLKGWFVNRSDSASAGMIRTLKFRVMLIKHLGTFPATGAPTTSFGNVNVAAISITLFQETSTGGLPIESVFNQVDHRQKTFHVLYDRVFTSTQEFVATTGSLNAKAKAFRAAVRINRKVKYDDQSTVPPSAIEGWNYSWIVFGWAPLETLGADVGAFGCAHYIHYTDS